MFYIVTIQSTGESLLFLVIASMALMNVLDKDEGGTAVW